MKLHLPLSLYRAVLGVLLVANTLGSAAYAATIHEDASMQTYTDFGQNCGRYVVGTSVNALVNHIRTTQGGIAITYTDGTAPFYISNEQGMIDFSATHDGGHSAMISATFLATVNHNANLNGEFSDRVVGSEHALSYSAVDIRNSSVFRLAPTTPVGSQYDYSLQRQSKIVTDATWNTLTTVTDIASLKDQYLYYSGAGTMYLYHNNSSESEYLAGFYVYNIGGINKINGTSVDDNGNLVLNQNPQLDNGIGATTDNPLPFGMRPGDSGSPSYIYNAATGQYEYVAAERGYSGASVSDSYGNVTWSQQTMESFNVHVAMDESNAEVYLNAASQAGETVTDGTYSTTKYSGLVEYSSGKESVSYIGTQSGINTWNTLASLKDTQTWYAYDSNAYLNRNVEDLFFTQNLVFTSSAKENSIVLKETVDLGIGYAEFNGGKFTITSEEGEGNRFNHAGYVINHGAEVHLQLVNPDKHMTEWRKTGAGDLYIDGTGDTNALLNVGGSGSTYLQQKFGYAAYNVLANTGATVILAAENGTAQIKRDFTFGAGGGTLDMNGNSMDWYTTAETTDDDNRFSINALTEQAMITNSSTTLSTLIYKEAKDTTYKGSFSGALAVDYMGGGTWTLHSIHTKLGDVAGSGLTVSNGKVILTGTNTIHGEGSATGTNADRLVKLNDWHYADATMPVQVKNGAVFELGSHARLTGDVTVESGGSYIMREGVQSLYEYVEGGAELEDTTLYSDFFGHKGDVDLAAGASMKVQYSQGVTTNNTYARNISGAGSLEIDLGSKEARFTLAGDNSNHTGTKTLTSGVLMAEDVAALGDTTTHKWKLAADTTLQVESGLTAANAPGHIDANSTGTLALTEDMADTMVMSGHKDLFVGAAAGKTVQYGTSDNTLAAVDNKWNLGGGGGELVVNAKLNDKNSTLVLGNGQGLGGIVQLTNTANNIGSITFSEGVTLTYDDTRALGGASIDLAYGSAVLTSADTAGLLSLVSKTSAGAVLLDKAGNAAIDMTVSPGLSLHSLGDAVYSGSISVGNNGTYRFGGSEGTLTVNAVLAADGTNDMVVDGQGHSGGKLMLGAATAISGHVTVQGHKDGGVGDMTLSFGEDNALASVSGVTVKDGGILDVGSTTQTLTNLVVQTGGLLKGNADGTLVFNMTTEVNGNNAYFQTGAMQLGKVEKTGAGEMVLASADNSWDLFTVKQGTLFTRVNNALSATGITRVEEGGVLSMNAWDADRTMHGNVVLGQGGRMETGGGNNIFFNGSISVDAGATGTLGSGTWYLNSLENNVNGGTLALEGGNLYFNQQNSQYIGGTVDVSSGNASFHRSGGGSDLLKKFNHICIAAGKQLSLEDTDGATGNTIWQMERLSGAGTLNWNSDSHFEYYGADKSTRLVIGGDGGFTGEINLNRSYSQGARMYQSYLEVNGENAISGATLNFKGTAANDNVTLAINADNVNVGGLNTVDGNKATHHVMAGAAVQTAVSSSAPASTRSAVLTVTGSGQYSFAGTIGTADDTVDKSLSLVMAGSGIQSFTGSTIVVNDVTALRGNLNIQSAGLKVMGDVAVAQGAGLSLNNSFTLNSGNTFHVLATEGTDSAAQFNSKLVLNGGTLSFQQAALGESPALNLVSGFSYAGVASSLVIGFDASYLLEEGTTYTLATGDWRDIADSLTTEGLGYFKATFKTNESGHLLMTLENHENVRVWAGANQWKINNFDGSGNKLTTSSIALFDDTAAIKDVKLGMNMTSSNEVAKMVFRSAEDYCISRMYEGTNAVIKTTELIQAGTGTTTLKNAVVVKGTTDIQQGTLVVQSTGMLQGRVQGEGKLVVDWTGEDSLKLGNMHEVEIKSGSLNVADADCQIQKLHLTGGSMTLQNGHDLQLQELSIASGQALTASQVVVQGLAEFEAGATLRAGLELVSGAELALDGTLTLEGGLSLQSGLTLSGTLLENVLHLTAGKSVELFKGVTTLSVQDTPVATLVDMRSLSEQTLDLLVHDGLMQDFQIAAGDFFENLAGNESLVLTYDATTGTVSIKDNTQSIPEPATAALSLLGLAALAARRRRKI